MRLTQKFVLALGLVALTSGTALALPPGIYISDHQQDPKASDFEKQLKKEQKSALVKDGAVWKLYFVAFLNKPAGTNELNIVFYDITGGKKEQGNAFPVSTQPTAKIIMSELDLSPEMDFKQGHKYDVRITRLQGGKETVYASTKLELK